MARPLDDRRRDALLAAAARVFAARGLVAPTSAISREAGVSEGSLFTYFRTKDDLILALYRALRAEMGDAVMLDYPADADVFTRLGHFWASYVGWGVDNPVQRQALRLAGLSPVVTDAVRAEPTPLFTALERLEADALAAGQMKRLPPHMAGGVLRSLGELTVEMISREPCRRESLILASFDVVLGALMR